MQPFVGKVLSEAFVKANVVMDVDHSRRLVRVLLRAAAQMAIRFGVPLPMFVAAATEAMLKEIHTEHPAVVPEIVLPQGKPNLHIVKTDSDDDLN